MKTKVMLHITRIDQRYTRLWWVRFFVGSGKDQRPVLAKTFPDLRHGGKRRALEAAQRWRDQGIRTMARLHSDRPSQGDALRGRYQTRLRSTNTSGVTGVHPRYIKGEHTSWVATWPQMAADGTWHGRRRQFRLDQFQEAVRWRKQMVKLHCRGELVKK